MSYLIKNCQLLETQTTVDVRLIDTEIAEISTSLQPTNTESIIDASGGLLLPGLHDHHIHLASLAASLASVQCGPPQVENQQQLLDLLQEKNQLVKAIGEPQWLRGIGYHNSVAGDIDKDWLDSVIPNRPVRIQHRGGRLWIFNSKGLEVLGLLANKPPSDIPKGVEYKGKWPSGRLVDCDHWIRTQLSSSLPSFSEASLHLASRGITGITDATPSNGADEWAFFQASQSNGTLSQKVRMMGGFNLPRHLDNRTLHLGEYKIHLLESALPDIDKLIESIKKAHETGRNVAIHCVTHTEMVFALTCLEVAKVLPGDRIEHASVTTPEMLEKIHLLGLRVVSQPHFIRERGDHYLREVEKNDQAWLYRQQSFIKAGIPLAAGSDAPFATPEPWDSMQSAVNRETTSGSVILPQERLTPELALGLYLSNADKPGISQKKITIGSTADLCLVNAPWESLKRDLSKTEVMATFIEGKLIYQPS